MKKIILLSFVLLLSGCSTTFVYKNANWLVHWYLDDYVQLNAEQEAQFDTMFEQWIQWHKTYELPLYQAHINDIVNDIKTQNINQQVIEQHRERARQHWVRARTHVADDVVRLAVTLDEKQVESFFKTLEDENLEDEEKIAERMEKPEEKQRKDWLKRNQKNLKKWMGRLSKSQENIIEGYYDDFSSTSEYWIEYKREYQAQLRDVFSLEQRAEEFKDRLHELIVNPEKFRSPTFQSLMDENAIASANYMIAIFDSASEKQKRRLLSEIEDLQEDIASLQK